MINECLKMGIQIQKNNWRYFIFRLELLCYFLKYFNVSNLFNYIVFKFFRLKLNLVHNHTMFPVFKLFKKCSKSQCVVSFLFALYVDSIGYSNREILIIDQRHMNIRCICGQEYMIIRVWMRITGETMLHWDYSLLS